MRVPTIKIRNEKTGDVLKVNQSDWASDLGRARFAGWTALSDAQNVEAEPDPPKQTVHEVTDTIRPEPPPIQPTPPQKKRATRRTNT